MDRYRWFVWGGVGVAALIVALLIAINAAIHTLRSAGQAVARTPSQVAFIDLTIRDGQQSSGDVYLVDVDSGEITRLTTGGQVSALAWTPDGESLYLSTRDAKPRAYTQRLDLATGALTPLTGDAQTRAVGPFVALSPDGRQIVYDTHRSLFEAGSKIYIAALDGSSAREVGEGGEPQWSPDGKRIVYAWAGGGDSDIYTMAADGSDVQKVAALPDEDLLPSWSQDGKTIVFASLTRDVWGAVREGYLYRVDPDGKNLVRLDRTVEPYQVKILPDGQGVYVHGLVSACLSPLDGADRTCRFTYQTDLSPDGKRVITAVSHDVMPGSAPGNERLCVGSIAGASLTDGPCLYDSKGGVFDLAWRPG